ncbi:MAG: hypothetical protein ACXWKH_04495, partial [Limisphaerales bacterium]
SAWTLSALARRDVYNGRRHLVGEPCAFRHELGESLAMRIPLDTWIIGYPTSPNEKLADWFADQSSNTSYRLIVNRIPLFFEDVKVAFNPWKHVHLSLKKSNFNLKHREGHYSHLKPSASRFMDEALAAYRMGTEREFFANLGHPFTYSDGLSHLV